MSSFTLSRLFFTHFKQRELFSAFLLFRLWFRPNIVQLMCISLEKMTNSMPLFVCVMFLGIDLLALKWHFGYSSIFKDTMTHRNGWKYVNEIFTVGRAHIKHSITSIMIRLIVDLIFLIYFFWNAIQNILGHPVYLLFILYSVCNFYYFPFCLTKICIISSLKQSMSVSTTFNVQIQFWFPLCISFLSFFVFLFLFYSFCV